MRQKIGTDNVSSSNEFYKNIDKIIINNHGNLLRVTNSALVILFWSIGIKINIFFTANKLIEQDKVIVDISQKLRGKYGDFFSESNIRKMISLATKFPKIELLKKISALLSWRHIVILLEVEGWENIISTLKYLFEKNISPHAFEQIISTAEYSKKKESLEKEKLDRKIDDVIKKGLKKITINTSLIENLYKEPLGNMFFPLLSSFKRFRIKNTLSKNIEQNLLHSLIIDITQYKISQNKWLNCYINLSFREIGELINENIDNKEANSYLAIRNISNRLNKKYGKNFNFRRISEMKKFSMLVTDPEDYTPIAYLLSWNHIKILLSLSNSKQMLFYAHLVAKTNMSPDALKKKIKTKKNDYAKKPLEELNLDKTIYIPDVWNNSFFMDFARML